MSVEYTPAPEVKDIAGKLIGLYHDPLLNEDIEYVFRSEASSSKGKVVLGKARKVTGLPAYLSRTSEEPFFLMEIALDTWENLSADQKEALVDHELCHFGITEDGRRFILPHDLEEFAAIVERHGLWNPAVKRIAAAVNDH